MYKKVICISMLLFATAIFGLAVAFGAGEEKSGPTSISEFLRQLRPSSIRSNKQLKPALENEELRQPEMEAEMEGTKDPNEPGYELWRLDRQGQEEMREWIYGKTDDRIRLAKMANDQVDAELNYIRKIAQQEGAVKTLESLDKILTARKERFGRTEKRIREQRTQMLQENQRGQSENLRQRGRGGNQPSSRNPRGSRGTQGQRGQGRRTNERETGLGGRIQGQNNLPMQ